MYLICYGSIFFFFLAVRFFNATYADELDRLSGPEGLMDDLYLSEEFWCTPSIDFGDAGVQHSLFQIQISSSLSMDDIFSRLLTLTSYLTHKLIRFIKDLVFTDIRQHSEYSLVTCDQEVRSSYYGDSGYPEGTSTSSRYWDCSKGLFVPENTDSEFKELTVFKFRNCRKQLQFWEHQCCFFKGVDATYIFSQIC